MAVLDGLMACIRSMPSYEQIILLTNLRLSRFEDKTWIKRTNKTIKVCDKNGRILTNPLMDTNGIYPKERDYVDDYRIIFREIMQMTIEEAYNFTEMGVQVTFVTHLNKKEWDRHARVIWNDYIIAEHSSTSKPLSTYDEPFIGYKVMSTFVKNLNKRNIKYAFSWLNENETLVVRFPNMKSVWVDRSNEHHRLFIANNEHGMGPYNTTEALQEIK